MNWPMVAVHSVLLKNGNLLIWDGWQNPEPTAVWNATSQTFPTTINAPGSIFCSGNVHLPDGRILTAGGDGIFTTGNLGLADTTIFDPGDGDVEARRRHEPAALVPVADRARRRPLRGHQRQLDQPDHVGRHARGLRPGGRHVDAADRRLDAAGPRGGVPVQLPRPERQGLHHRPGGGQLVLPRRRRQDVDAGRRRQRRGQRLVGHVPPGQDPLQRRRAERPVVDDGQGQRGRHRPHRRARRPGAPCPRCTARASTTR